VIRTTLGIRPRHGQRPTIAAEAGPDPSGQFVTESRNVVERTVKVTVGTDLGNPKFDAAPAVFVHSTVKRPEMRLFPNAEQGFAIDGRLRRRIRVERREQNENDRTTQRTQDPGNKASFNRNHSRPSHVIPPRRMAAQVLCQLE
jgi:hypothetical protein